jgi:hypothetical protein
VINVRNVSYIHYRKGGKEGRRKDGKKEEGKEGKKENYVTRSFVINIKN